MKKVMRYVVLLCVIILVAGCSKHTKNDIRIVNDSVVNEVLESQIADTNAQELKQDEQTKDKEESVVKEEETSQKSVSDAIDYDLTEMGSDMIYATVYQLMVNPDDYIGKKIRIKGNYYATWYEPKQQYYHYVIIQDATACCAQGLEFVWDDGSHVYPDEYPADETEVVVTGVFETYKEDGDSNLYCRLKNASITYSK